MILIDPNPRTLDQIFSPEARTRPEALLAGRAADAHAHADPATAERLRSRPIG